MNSIIDKPASFAKLVIPIKKGNCLGDRLQRRFQTNIKIADREGKALTAKADGKFGCCQRPNFHAARSLISSSPIDTKFRTEFTT